jgi:membrane protein YqaA with SNARE-associated domain
LNSEIAAAAPLTRNPLRRVYLWILSWAHHPMGTGVLAVLSFLDSFVFPIPPLFLQLALALERPKRSFWYATVNTVASVLGAVAGYYIGQFLWDSIGVRIVGEISPERRRMLAENQFLVTLGYSFAPMPFKFITLGSGFLQLSLPTLLLASTLGRSLRFFLLAAICHVKGRSVKDFIEKYFNWVCLGVGALVLAVVGVMKLLGR